jgi:plasmid maintenance system killer protein
MKILDLTPHLKAILDRHGLRKAFGKQKSLFENNWRHPSLHTEILEPRHLKIYSFRITQKWRALFFVKNSVVEVFDITDYH